MKIGIDEVMSRLVQQHYPTDEILESLAMALEDQSRAVKAHGNKALAAEYWGEATTVRRIISSVAK